MTALAEKTQYPEHDAPSFKAVMSEMPSAVTVITCLGADGTPVGATLSAVSSLSLEPALMLACFDKRSKTLSALGEKGQAFLIHILAKDQQTLAKTFATSASDKFSTVDWSNGPSGLPCFEGCVGVVECAVEDHLPGGDHVIVTGAVKRVHRDDKRAPLVYHRRELLPLAS